MPGVDDGDRPNVEPEIKPSTPAPSPEPTPEPEPQKIGGDDAPSDPEQAASSVSFDDDWRKFLAGDDDAALTELTRIKTPQDLVKQLANQKKELSKRAISGQFPEDADEATQKAWRDHHGVPDEGTVKAYDIKTPEGYEVSEVESGMIDEYVKELHGANAPQAVVQKSVDQWFKMNAANMQNMRAVDDSRHKEWSEEIRGELGKDYEPIIAAANTYFEQAMPDAESRNEFLNARLPGGGILAEHPEFIRMISDAALKNGYGDRIEANSMEAGGKSLAEQRLDIEQLRRTDRARYDLPATQDKLKKLIALQLSRGDIKG